jgi:hypothetical protein
MALLQKGKEESEKEKSVATDTVDGESDTSRNRARSQGKPPPPPMELLTQIPPSKPTDTSENRGAKSPEAAAKGEVNMLSTLGGDEDWY